MEAEAKEDGEQQLPSPQQSGRSLEQWRISENGRRIKQKSHAMGSVIVLCVAYVYIKRCRASKREKPDRQSLRATLGSDARLQKVGVHPKKKKGRLSCIEPEGQPSSCL